MRIPSKPSGAMLLSMFLLPACGGETAKPAQSAPAAQPSPPAAIETSLGRLVKTGRVAQATLLARCILSPRDNMVGVVSTSAPGDPFSIVKRGEREVYTSKAGVKVMVVLDGAGVCQESEAGAPGRDFLVLTFEGAAKRSFEKEGISTFQAAGAAGLLVRSDSHSTLTDPAASFEAAGLVLVAEAEGRQLAFEIPTGAKELVWKDGEHAYRLDPTPRPLAPAGSGS